MRVLLFFYLMTAGFVLLWIYVYYVATCPSQRPISHVDLPSGGRITILEFESQEWFWERSFVVIYVTNTDGRYDSVKAEARNLLGTLESNDTIPEEANRLYFDAWYTHMRFDGWYGFTPVFSCCSSNVVIFKRHESNDWVGYGY